MSRSNLRVRFLSGEPRGWRGQCLEGVKELTGCHPEQSEGSPQSLWFKHLRGTAERLLRRLTDQHDRFDFFHSFLRRLTPRPSNINRPRGASGAFLQLECARPIIAQLVGTRRRLAPTRYADGFGGRGERRSP